MQGEESVYLVERRKLQILSQMSCINQQPLSVLTSAAYLVLNVVKVSFCRNCDSSSCSKARFMKEMALQMPLCRIVIF